MIISALYFNWDCSECGTVEWSGVVMRWDGAVGWCGVVVVVLVRLSVSSLSC